MIKNIFRFTDCPACGKSYFSPIVSWIIRDEHKQQYLLHIVCEKDNCKVAQLAYFYRDFSSDNPLDFLQIHEVRMLTDLSSGEVKKFLESSVISSEYILDLFETSKSDITFNEI